jgi:hypothetical protein
MYYPPPGAQPPGKSNTVAIVIGVVAVCVLVFGACGVSILLPSLSRAREMANRVKCAANLKQIGNAAMMYANDNYGAYAPSIEGLVEYGIPAIFVCPACNDTPAVAAGTPKATAANVLAGGHLSYVYVGKGLTSRTARANAIVAYEPLTNHRNQGMNVLYGDSSVQWLTLPQANAALAELQAGHNPPRLTRP